MMNETLSYAPVILKLLQGPLYAEESRLWGLLQQEAAAIHSFFAQIGLQLVILNEEALAYLRQDDQDEDTQDLPRLIKRSPLGYEATLLAVILRDALEEFDLSNADSRDLFLTARDLRARLKPYQADQFDEARAARQFERTVRHAVKLGFLRETGKGEDTDFERKVFQVMRILKAKLGPSQLEELRQKFLSAR